MVWLDYIKPPPACQVIITHLDAQCDKKLHAKKETHFLLYGRKRVSENSIG
jgi:hypothetical protein